MKKLLLCIATSVMAMGAVAQIQVTSDGSVKLSKKIKVISSTGNMHFAEGTDLRFGCDTLFNSPQWSIEYLTDGLNFWKPDGSTNAGDGKLFLKDNGNVFIGTRYGSAKLHVVGPNIILAPTNTNYSQLEFGVTQNYPRIKANNTITFYKRDNSGYVNIQCGSISQSSDSTLKTNITKLEQNALSKICKLNGYTYNWKNDEEKKIQVGFIAQEVEQIFPELVETIDSSNVKLLSYIGVIPYLVEAMKEQQKEIEDLKSQLNTEKTYELKSTSVAEIHSSVEQASLSQNKPNPFSTNTRIEMVIPETVADAVLYIYDLQGKQVKAIMVSGRGATSEIIFGNELEAGLYIYSLVTDGKLVGSKQMILTE
ncbi:MAG: tail fiber domain-containing protein [Bacteroidales bacterium]|nr:tail fiber domain-containing protein [Bacteroidales bacterium]